MIKKFFFNNYFIVILLCIAFYRSPYIFIDGRFLSLDLAYHFISEKLSFFNAITYIDYSPRYINLISNISSIISSRLFQLENAQFVAVYLSLFIYLTIFKYILSFDSLLFDTKIKKYSGALICLIAPIMNFEIWLNAINLQVYLGLLTIVIFFKISDKFKYLDYSFLTISGLSGIYSCALAPLYFFKFLNYRTKNNFICLSILSICAIIQLFIIYYSTSHQPSNTINQALTFNFTKFESISFFYNIFVRSFFGSSIPLFISGLFNLNLNSILNNDMIRDIFFLISTFFSIIVITFSFYLIKSIKTSNEKRTLIYLLFAFLLFSIVVVIGGVSDSIHGRYSSLPGLMLIFFILFISNKLKLNFLKLFFSFLIICTLLTGLLDFRYNKYIYYLDCIECPNWDTEVKKYKNNNNYKINAWPYHINR